MPEEPELKTINQMAETIRILWKRVQDLEAK